MPPLDHSVHSLSRPEYGSSGGWPPADLQISSFRSMARRVFRRTKHSNQGRRPNDNPAQPVPTEAGAQKPRRPLTPPFTSTKDTAPTTHPQSQSPFFSLLPPEIRQEIYRHVLGLSNIHIKQSVRSLEHLRCKCSSCPGYAYYYDYGTSWKRTWACDESKYDYDSDRLPVGILTSCRRVYAEAMAALYGSNTFGFQDEAVMRRFVASLPEHRRGLVSSVQLDLAAERLGRDVKAVCDTLICLPGLRSLEIRVHPSKTKGEGGLALLRPLACLREKEGLGQVRLYLPFPAEGELWLHESPFETLPLDGWTWFQRYKLPRNIFVL